ncbi:DJ-1/PfpI family protein [Psychrobacter sp. JCM 18900]|uniref:DJ-1/PfpI family protein n=1 Tax=Psychrobacter sp. JCM 18900 TaxID=1298608 RepID=UPI000434A9E4|nr:DJ-1/PfpI family protein [Psychrobacter sp. JCM 18900]GAF52003.1 LOW QUALITY PROTEIN: ThiJ/PfpI family protein [Psychrobacter sp. JCM 18900]
MTLKRTVGILLFNEVEVLDFAGPFEVFSLAENAASSSDDKHFKVITIAENQATISARNGLQVIPDYSFAKHPDIDVLIIPGGYGAEKTEIYNKVVIDWIITQASLAELTLSVCTGALLLAKAGLLAGKSATTHWMDLDNLASYPDIDVISHTRFVDASDDTGNIVTSAGISAGIHASLYCIEKLIDSETMRATAHRMEFDID